MSEINNFSVSKILASFLENLVLHNFRIYFLYKYKFHIYFNHSRLSLLLYKTVLYKLLYIILKYAKIGDVQLLQIYYYYKSYIYVNFNTYVFFKLLHKVRRSHLQKVSSTNSITSRVLHIVYH